jgi:hypothetical protein
MMTTGHLARTSACAVMASNLPTPLPRLHRNMLSHLAFPCCHACCGFPNSLSDQEVICDSKLLDYFIKIKPLSNHPIQVLVRHLPWLPKSLRESEPPSCNIGLTFPAGPGSSPIRSDAESLSVQYRLLLSSRHPCLHFHLPAHPCGTSSLTLRPLAPSSTPSTQNALC